MTTTRKSTTKKKTTATRKASTTKTSTRAKSSSTAKTAATSTSKKAAPKVAPVVVEAPQPVVAGPMMRKKELIDAVVAQSGVKKRDAKPVVEAMLQILGDSLRDGRELNLQPLGKVMVRRSKKTQSGTVLMTKVRLKDPEPHTPKLPDAAE